MSSHTYYKMLLVGQKVRKNINNANKVCAQKPKSQECRDAWEHVNDYCIEYDNCQVKHIIELKKETGVELLWENYND